MTIIQQKPRSSKKLTYLLKECRNEMVEMKYEIFDIQNALNACRSSLKTLNISDMTTTTTTPTNISTMVMPSATKQRRYVKPRCRQLRRPNVKLFSEDSSSLLSSSSNTTLSYVSSSYQSNYYPGTVYRPIIRYKKHPIMNSTSDDYSLVMSSGYCNNRRPKKVPIRRTTYKNPLAYPGSKRYESIEKRRTAEKSTFRHSASSFSSPVSLLKDHFTVINHKQESIFEPKSSSTPIYREQKTSTPLLEKAMHRLTSSDNYAVVVGLKKPIYLLDESNAYDIPEPRSNNNDYQIPATTVSTSTRRLNKQEKTESLKNLTLVSSASSMKSSVVQCCIKPFKFFSSKNVKKCLKKF